MMIRAAILTASDRCSRGEAEDRSGALLEAFCRAEGWEIVFQRVTPDDRAAIAAALVEAVDEQGADLALTTGGTGLGPRDVTPEATAEACDRLAPGIAEALRAESLKKTPFAMLSRGAAGMRGRCLIVNLPGSPKAVQECLEILKPILPHAIEMAHGGGH